MLCVTINLTSTRTFPELVIRRTFYDICCSDSTPRTQSCPGVLGNKDRTIELLGDGDDGFDMVEDAHHVEEDNKHMANGEIGGCGRDLASLQLIAKISFVQACVFLCA